MKNLKLPIKILYLVVKVRIYFEDVQILNNLIIIYFMCFRSNLNLFFRSKVRLKVSYSACFKITPPHTHTRIKKFTIQKRTTICTKNGSSFEGIIVTSPKEKLATKAAARCSRQNTTLAFVSRIHNDPAKNQQVCFSPL